MSVAERSHGISPWRTAFEMLVGRPAYRAAESLSFKQSWKDGHWYCDGLTISPLAEETLDDAYDRYLVLKARIDADLGATTVGEDDETPF